MEYVWLDVNVMPADEISAAVRDINRLIAQVATSPKKISALHLQLMGSRGSRVMVARQTTHNHPDGAASYVAHVICAMATLVPVFTLQGMKARIEDVAVDEDRRGQGIAKTLLARLIQDARYDSYVQLDLTSHPRRETANALYVKLGFEHYETNVYRLKL